MSLKQFRVLLIHTTTSALFITLLVVVTPLSIVKTNAAFETELQMEIRFGLGGRFRPGYATPVNISITNHGIPIHGTLLVRSQHGSPIASLSQTITYAQPVFLASGVPVSVELHTVLSNAFHPLRIELRDDSGRLLASETLDLQRRVVEGDILLALDPSGREWSWLQMQAGSQITARGQRIGVEVIYLDSPQLLPAAWVGYQGATAVAISSSFPLRSLSDAQTKALGQWVDAGGLLIWAGGHRLDATRSPLAQSHSPLTLTGRTRRIELSRLSTRYPEFPPNTDLIVWEGQSQGEVLAQAAGLPLLSRKAHGLGHSFLMAFDPYTLDLTDWSGMGDLTREALSGATTIQPGLAEAEEAVWDFIRTTHLPYPARHLPALILIGYCVSVAFLMYKASGRPLRALFAIMASVLFFSFLVMFSLGLTAQVSQYGMAELSVTTANPKGAGLTWTFQGLHSFRADTWHFRSLPHSWGPVPAEFVLTDAAERDTYLERHGDDSAVVSTEPDALSRFRSSQPTQLAIDATLTLQSREYRLSVTNELPAHLAFVYYVDPLHFSRLGPMDSGETVTHTFAAGVQTTSYPSPQWIGTSVATDIERNTNIPNRERLGYLVAALVARRLRSGASRVAGDDGFLVGFMQSETATVVEPEPTIQSGHIVLIDLNLQGSR